ncbi:3-hydroxyanthranilate 3,4-dioxygenase [Paramormyrops kingsleyae]|uniref:3-hydroxyanthranilate 3,4-dioxygenase n=1 Tax=Paramormyrops kingsleyae TaxID=1676925 RepID=A0A3B3QM75_9TELE|nr:3-hydroxyanthranilate 3,4-dioxygenase [Paramormyrops kingsleyae]
MENTENRLVNVDEWIAENEKAFLPPVCNKLMFSRQLNIMFVGGPNTRKDYHIEEGEELFYQLRGDMVLKVIENGKHREVLIREGEMFLLPARIPHSPQREANTVGLVVERKRLLSETDCLRYYVDNTTDILFERWFYCEDLGVQLVPVIQEFLKSEQCRTGKPSPDESFRQPPFQLNTMNVMTPFSFGDWVSRRHAELDQGRPLDMFGAQFETEAVLYGPGQTAACTRNTDVWIWQLEGTSQVTVDSTPYSLSPRDSLLIPGQNGYQWARDKGCVALLLTQDPERKSTYT